MALGVSLALFSLPRGSVSAPPAADQHATADTTNPGAAPAAPATPVEPAALAPSYTPSPSRTEHPTSPLLRVAYATPLLAKTDMPSLDQVGRLAPPPTELASLRLPGQLAEPSRSESFSIVRKVDAPGKPVPPALNPQRDLRQIEVTVNKAETLTLGRPYNVALVGNPEIADVVPLSERMIYILGKKVGMTRLSILDADKNVVGIVEVEVRYSVDDLQRQFSDILPSAEIVVKSVNGGLFLTGTVPDAVTLQRAIAIAEQIAPKAVTNALSVDSPQQVMLEVRFVEASREAARDLGIGWNVVANRFLGATLLGNLGSNAVDFGAGAANLLDSGLASGQVPFGTAVARLLNGGVKADVILQALEQRNLARRLAEPNLVALSGDTASFLAGGEFPFPVPTSDNRAPAIEFKKFGVSLAFTPTVLGSGLINLRIVPEVSEISQVAAVRLAGDIAVPSLVVRRAETTVELRDGQSFAIAGLLQANNVKIQQQLPWVGDVPVLGTLFRSASFQKNETDLVIIVTPRLVQPAAPGQKLITPLDQRIASQDVDFFVTGRQDVPAAAAAPIPHQGHLLEASPAVLQAWDTVDEPTDGLKDARGAYESGSPR